MLNILQVNKFFYIKGGSETYYFSLKQLLEQNGHKTIDFSMKDERNFESQYSSYFVSNVDYNNNSNILEKIRIGFKVIYSFEAKNKIAELLQNEKIDIAHLHLFQHQLSPSILKELKKRNIPIVYTAHELKSVCPNYKMYSNGKVCEKCKGNKFYQCFLSKCVKNSYTKSAINTVEMYVHRILKSYDLIDIIITPSDFYRNKLIEFGIDEKKVVFIPNYLDADNFEPSYEYKNYFLYLGRLSDEKGILTLLKAMNFVDGTQLHVVGTGPMEDELKQYVRENRLESKVKFLGFKSGNELKEIIRGSMFSVIPSEWYENGPYSVLEMMAYGKPVIGSDMGGIPEFIENNRTGLVFKKGNVDELASKINFLLNNKDEIVNFGKGARQRLETKYNSQLHYLKVNDIYERLVAKNKVRNY